MNFVSGKVMTYVFQSHERENEVQECKAAQDKVKKYKVKIRFTNLNQILKKSFNIQIAREEYLRTTWSLQHFIISDIMKNFAMPYEDT